MKNLIEAYGIAVGTWAQNLSRKSLTRTVNALDSLRQGTYGTPELTKDIYQYWRDLADFRAPAAIGLIPAASLDIAAWPSSPVSNFVQVPVGLQLALTPVVNPQTTTVLAGLELDSNAGENAVRVRWVGANAGKPPSAPADRKGLFQGAIFETRDGELIATVYVITRLP